MKEERFCPTREDPVRRSEIRRPRGAPPGVRRVPELRGLTSAALTYPRRFFSIKRTGQKVLEIASTSVPDFGSSQILVLSCPNQAFRLRFHRLLLAKSENHGMSITQFQAKWIKKHNRCFTRRMDRGDAALGGHLRMTLRIVR